MAYPIDLALIKDDNDNFDIDWDDNGDFVMTETYETAILMSVLGERRAKDYEITTPKLRRGWIGNLLYTDGSEDGSGAWLYKQRRLNLSTINGARDEVEKGLLWFMDESIVDQVTVTSSISDGKINVTVTLKSSNEAMINTTITL